VFNVFFLKPKT